MMPASVGSLPEKPQHCSVHLCFKSSPREIAVTKTSREATWGEIYAQAATRPRPRAKQLLNLKQTYGLLA